MAFLYNQKLHLSLCNMHRLGAFLSNRLLNTGLIQHWAVSLCEGQKNEDSRLMMKKIPKADIVNLVETDIGGQLGQFP